VRKQNRLEIETKPNERSQTRKINSGKSPYLLQKKHEEASRGNAYKEPNKSKFLTRTGNPVFLQGTPNFQSTLDALHPAKPQTIPQSVHGQSERDYSSKPYQVLKTKNSDP